ncbi:MAG TPA: enoyl-CoA hydratase-related protein, partial [bacterium]|nr:enoyl-CoA hydratase-related protein [bacterium]
ITVGCYPPIALATLGARIGHQRMAQLILSGRTFSAPEALDWGLVNAVAPREQLPEAVGRIVDGIAARSSRATRAHTLQTLRRIRKLTLEPALRIAEEAYGDLPPEDLEEGITAFLEKRPPQWRNR